MWGEVPSALCGDGSEASRIHKLLFSNCNKQNKKQSRVRARLQAPPATGVPAGDDRWGREGEPAPSALAAMARAGDGVPMEGS